LILLGRLNPGKLLSWLALSAAAALIVAGLPAVAAAQKSHKSKGRVVGRIYTETNGKANRVLIFNRFANGKLALAGSAATGGAGGFQPQPGCTPVCPFLDTQDEIVSTADGKLVFAVNAGSSTITSFRATSTGLHKVSVVSSHGKFPNSLTIHRTWLYVLNSDSDNIAGLRACSRPGNRS